MGAGFDQCKLPCKVEGGTVVLDAAYATDGDALAIRGHSSAHSLHTGPVMAEPFISPLGLTITPALSVAEQGERGRERREGEKGGSGTEARRVSVSECECVSVCVCECVSVCVCECVSV